MRILTEATENEGTRWLALVDMLRFARLCAWLRQREPDGEIGCSVLLYRLSEKDLQQALYGPPAELAPRIMVEGMVVR